MTRPLRAVRAHPDRALALIRVSRERDGMVSPELQRVAITDHAARTGRTIVDTLEGLDESGSARSSKWWATLERAVAMVEAGDVDVILVWKFSRVARNRLRWAVAVDRVEAAGGRIESATEQVDTSTSTGRFTRGMLAELQAFEAERIGEVWRETHARRLSLGLPSRGGDRFGYVRDPDRRDTYAPHPEHGPILAGMYAAFVAGRGFASIARDLNRAGVATRTGRPWSRDGVARVLDSGFGAGQLVTGRGARAEYRPGQHPAVIDDDTWAAYLQARQARRGTPPRDASPRYVLTGLIRCGDCGAPMHATTLGKHTGYGYVCSRWSATGLGRCVTVTRHKAEAAVLEWLHGQVAADVEATAATLAARDSAALVARQDATTLARQVARLDERLARLTLGWTDGTVPDAAYAAARDELQQARDDVAGQLAAAERAAARHAAPVRPAAVGLVDGWDVLPVQARRDMLRHLLTAVFVDRPHDGGPVTVRVVASWETTTG